MASQKDYGDAADKMLVPGSLRAFRHFAIDERYGIIAPMNYRPPAPVGGFYMDSYQPRRETVYGPGYQRTFEARCIRRQGLFSWEHDGPVQTHASPDRVCTCGFYAHYRQSEDFYPHVMWGREYFADLMQEHMGALIVMRAVVEISGTTVMGRKGVRAQKMQIKAMAVDWSKFRDPRRRAEPPQFEYWASTPSKSFRDPYFELRVLRDDEPDPHERHRVESAAEEIVVGRYGVEFYRSVEEMYRDHPEADVSALGIDPDAPAPDPVEKSWGQVRRDLQRHQVAMYASAAKLSAAADDLRKQLSKILGVDTDLTDTGGKPKREKKRTPKVEIDNPAFKRALLNKQQRSAPPGTGIDRRRGRLR